MADECIFCRIVKGEIPAEKVHEDEDVVVFKDIHPAAPVHLLIVPRVHIPTLNDVTADQFPLLGKLLVTARDVAKKAGIAESGYRTIINCNRGAGQEVFHLHVHVLGGRPVGAMG
ncbi:MAG: histidine triad nucleotide-binding protein [Pseudomonadota bacterium]